MPKKEPRGTDFAKVCAYCEKATILADHDTVLCSRYGVVPAGGVCRKFLYDPLKRVPAPPLIPPEVSEVDLTL